MENKPKNKIKKREYWKAEEEIIIQQWADKAQCYQWMHARCREIYQPKNAWYTIPVIIISTITGRRVYLWLGADGNFDIDFIRIIFFKFCISKKA